MNFKYPQDVLRTKILQGRVNCGYCRYNGQGLIPWCSRRKGQPIPGRINIEHQICALFRGTEDGQLKYPAQQGFEAGTAV